MNVKINLQRSVTIAATGVATAETLHPLSAFALTTGYDAGASTIAATGVYAALVGLGLPASPTIVSTLLTTTEGGFCVVGPSGLIPFTITRVTHRAAFGCVLKLARDVQFGNSAIWRSAFNSTDNSVISGNTITGGSNYYINNNLYRGLEDNSFVSPAGNFSSVPGISAQATYSDQGAYGTTQTLIELLPPSSIGFPLSGFQVAVPALSINASPISPDNFIAYTVAAGSSNRTLTGLLNSTYELRIESAYLDAAASLAGALYAVTQIRSGAGLSLGVPQDTSGAFTVFPDVLGTPNSGTGTADYACVNLTRLASGVWTGASATNSVTITQMGTGAGLGGVTGSTLSGGLFAGINTSAYTKL